MMKLFLVGVMAALSLLCSCNNTSTENSGAQVTIKKLKSDFLIQAKAMNNGEAISTKYRKGHVSSRTLLKTPALSNTGYTLDMPGTFPIPTPSYYKGKLYVSGGFGSKTFYCLDAKTGKNIWAVTLDDDGPSTAVIQDDTVVFNTESCTLFALDSSNGKMRWSWWLGDPLTSAPAIHKGKVYTTYPAKKKLSQHQINILNKNPTTKNNKMKDISKAKVSLPKATHILGCFELKTGKILWQKWIDGDAMSAPVIDHNNVYITTFPGTVYKFNCNDGFILAASKARATSAPIIVNNEVLYSKRIDGVKSKSAFECLSWNDSNFNLRFTINGKKAVYLEPKVQENSEQSKNLKKLDAGNGFAAAPAAAGGFIANDNIGQYRVSGMQSFQGSRALHAYKKIYSTMGNELICSSAKKIYWRVPIKGDMKKLGGFMATPPVGVGGEIIMATIDGRVLRIDPKSGKIIKTYETKSPIRFQPTVVDGNIFVGTQNGKLIMIKTGNKKLTGWPMWGKDCGHSGKAE